MLKWACCQPHSILDAGQAACAIRWRTVKFNGLSDS
jgi:hypothetical protein